MTTGVLLMTYGAATTPDDVPAYLQRVYRGRAPAEVIEDFQERARLVGGSPLVEITKAQAAALEKALGAGYRVEVGMRHTPPFLADGLARLAQDGVEHIVAIVMSPQYSPHIMGGYLTEVGEACERVCPGIGLHVAGPWHDLPSFLDALAARVERALARVPEDERDTVPVLFTSHSLPERVVAREQDYLEQMTTTAREVAKRVGLPDERWRWAYQSAGHSPEPWLEPDMKDLLPGLAAAGHKRVLMVPVQFLADHLETLYDIDVAAAQEARQQGLAFQRIEMFNADPAFVDVLADVVEREEAAHRVEG